MNIMRWDPAHLAVPAAVAITALLMATATLRDAQSATASSILSEAVRVTNPSSEYPDGSANAPAGTPQLPNLFNRDAVRPPWKVAGVDYHVGVPTGLTLKTPTAGDLPAGATLRGQTIIVSTDNVTITGFDFSGNGGYGIYIEPGVSNTRIVNNYIAASVSTAPIAVNVASGASRTYIADNTIDGGGASGNTSFGETIFNQGTGLTVRHNFIRNVPQHFVSMGVGSLVYEFNLLENGAMAAGAHLNYLQYGGGASANEAVEFNTFVQNKTAGGAGEGVQMYNNSAGSITGGDIGFNTMVSTTLAVRANARGPAVSFWIHVGTSRQDQSPATGTVHDNYIDTSSAYGAFYPGLTGFTYSRNTNLVTGAPLPAPQGSTP
jgi:Right handed beta helix region